MFIVCLKSLHFIYVLFSSPCGKKFRSKPQIARFLGDLADLTCFDFSRAGTPGDGTQRRRARDRSIKKISELPRQFPLVRPLTNNPLRPSGPIRRTCGVIKLPVTWVAPPSDDELRNNLIATYASDPKQQSPISVIVQSLWEKRLFGVKPCDHMTGSEIAESKTPNGVVDASELIKTSPLTPIRKPHSPLFVSPVQSAHPMKSPPPIMSPTQLRQQQQQRPNTVPSLLSYNPQQQLNSLQQNGQQQARLAGKDLLYLSLQQQTQSTQQLSQDLPNGPTQQPQPAIQVPVVVTENELRLQEERVRLIRQQLLAAQSTA